MRKIYTIGKIILDILFDQNMTAHNSNVGGGVLNTTVGIKHLGGQVEFVSCIGDDRVGDIFDAFLQKEELPRTLI